MTKEMTFGGGKVRTLEYTSKPFDLVLRTLIVEEIVKDTTEMTKWINDKREKDHVALEDVADEIIVPSQKGTLVHEMSQFFKIAGTPDYANYEANCLNLPLNNPQSAICNMDSPTSISVRGGESVRNFDGPFDVKGGGIVTFAIP